MIRLHVQAHTDIRRLEFLPYHFLLGSVGDLGVLRFQVSLHCLSTPYACENTQTNRNVLQLLAGVHLYARGHLLRL